MPALGSLNPDPSLTVSAPRLIVDQSPRGARVSVANPPPFAAMGREALHLVAGVALTAALVILGLYLLRVNGGEWWYQGLVCLVVSGFVIAAVAAEAYRNCGIVTEIAVRDDHLVWRKANLWGEREYRWPLHTVRRAHAHGWYVRWRMKRRCNALTITRHDGWPLRAFLRYPLDEIRHAAHTLNRAMGQRD